MNPYSADDVADAIERALSMTREERIARWRPMFEGVMAQDIGWWLSRFTDALTRNGIAGHQAFELPFGTNGR